MFCGPRTVLAEMSPYRRCYTRLTRTAWKGRPEGDELWNLLHRSELHASVDVVGQSIGRFIELPHTGFRQQSLATAHCTLQHPVTPLQAGVMRSAGFGAC